MIFLMKLIIAIIAIFFAILFLIVLYVIDSLIKDKSQDSLIHKESFLEKIDRRFGRKIINPNKLPIGFKKPSWMGNF